LDTRNIQKSRAILSPEQTKRMLIGVGIDIEGEVDTDYIIFCPYHGNHRTPAGEIDKYSGFFYCFSCHEVADPYEFIMHVSKRSYFEAARYIKSKEQEGSIAQEVANKLTEKPDYVPFDELLIQRLNKQALDSARAMTYYNGRRITESSVKKFGLGYSTNRDMVTIPVHSPDGIAVGFVGRSVEGKEFKNTPKLPKSKVLFNLHRVKNSSKVYVVESSFDAIRLDQVGFPAVATLGANVSNIQIELLRKYFNNIYVIADNDEAGGNMKERVVERLGSRVSVITLDKKYKDIGEMEDEAITSLEFSFDKSIAAMLS
jgi:DNA primase